MDGLTALVRPTSIPLTVPPCYLRRVCDRSAVGGHPSVVVSEVVRVSAVVR
jgi:hypothetical protein